MATFEDILKAKQPDVWAQLTGQAGAQGEPTPGPVAAAPVVPSPAPSAPAGPKLQAPDVEALKEAERQASLAGHAASVLRGFREAGNIARGGRSAETDFSDLEAMRKAPLEAYARRQAAREAANKAVMEQLQGAHTQAQTAHIPVEEQQKAAEIAETAKYHGGELQNRAEQTQAQRDIAHATDVREALRRDLDRNLHYSQLSSKEQEAMLDRLSREKIAAEKVAALGSTQHNARASGLAKNAASIDSAIADEAAQYKAANEGSRGGGIVSGVAEHIPLVGHAIGAALAPKASAIRGGSKAETESTATAVGGGAATSQRMQALEPLALDPSLSKTALKERHDIKSKRLVERRANLQNEARALGITLAAPGERGGTEPSAPAATHYKYNADRSLRIPTDASGAELGPPEPNK